jgi:hypothetical protein
LSVILPIGGLDRARQFGSVLAGFLGQDDAVAEIVVVEHAAERDAERLCPPGVRYVFVPNPEGRPFNKSMALNEGVRVARAPVVLLHDCDIVPPAGYARALLSILEAGWDAVRPLRFIFHLDAGASERFIASRGSEWPLSVADVQQNNPGASTAVRRDRYDDIGGHDERFWGWGAEDLDFLDRLRSTRLFAGAFVPAIHLWHPPAANKSGDRNAPQLEALRQMSVADRIALLTSRARGVDVRGAPSAETPGRR